MYHFDTETVMISGGVSKFPDFFHFFVVFWDIYYYF